MNSLMSPEEGPERKLINEDQYKVADGGPDEFLDVSPDEGKDEGPEGKLTNEGHYKAPDIRPDEFLDKSPDGKINESPQKVPDGDPNEDHNGGDSPADGDHDGLELFNSEVLDDSPDGKCLIEDQ